MPCVVMGTLDFGRRFPSGVLSFEQFRRTDYFKVLDGWRAVSILMVLLFHARPLEWSFLHTFQGNGRYGVSFFFAISGFLITTLFLREERNTGQIDLWKFYGRRAVRLLPLYYAVLMMEAILIFVFNQYSPANQELFKEKFTSYLFYYSNWLKTSGVGPFFYSWSLAVEEQFYLVFGFLMVCCSRRVLIPLAMLVCVLKPTVFYFFGPIDTDSMLWRVVFSYHEPILMGVLTAFLLNHRPAYEVLAKILARPAVLAAVLLSLFGSLSLYAFEGKSSIPAQGLYVLMILTLVASVMRRTMPVLTTQPFLHWGRISYGMYLMHMFVLIAVWKYVPFPPTMSFVFVLASLTALASFSYKYFESPLINYFRKRLSVPRRVPVRIASAVTAEPRPALAVALTAE